MLAEEKFNALLPMQYAIVQEKKFLDNGFNEGHWLFMIITEMAEAINAERTKKIAPMLMVNEILYQIDWNETCDWDGIYEHEIKHSLQDEFADIYIRLLSFCSVKKMEIQSKTLQLPQRIMTAKTLPEQFMALTGMLWKAYFHVDTDTEETYISLFYLSLNYIMLSHNIEIEKFIKIKMEYNKQMEILNGKAY